MKLDQNEFPDLRNAFPPVPDSFMERIKETLDKVADEEPAPRFRLPKSPLLIAAILILSLSTVAVALSLLGWTDFFADYNVQMTVATQQALQRSEPQSFNVGPLTFTFQEYFTDGRVVLGSTSVTATDSKATFVNDGIDIPVSADLSTPCYRVRAILDVDPQYRDKHPCMEEVLFNELGQPVYFNMLTINPTTDLQEVPVTYQMFAWQIDPKTGSVIDQWTAEAELTIPVTVLKGTHSYTPEDVFVSSGYELKNVTADLTAAGVYLKAVFIAEEGAQYDQLPNLFWYDASNSEYSAGINLISYVDFDAWPEVTCEYLISADEMPQILQLSDQVNSVILK